MTTIADAEPGKVEALRIPRTAAMPNNPDLPLLLYRNALPPGGDRAAQCEAMFERNGWGDGWRFDAIYPYHHYHATRHEAIGVARGSARVRFGGDDGPVVEVAAGDVVVIPAGVAHKSESKSRDFLIVGAYPDRRGDPDICTGDPARRADEEEKIGRTKLPSADPVHGRSGPMFAHWRTR